MLYLKDAISIISSQEEFDCEVTQCNHTKRIGGEYLRLSKVKTTGPINNRGQYVRLLLQNGGYQTVHLKLIRKVNGELVV